MQTGEGLLKPWRWALGRPANYRLEESFPVRRYVNLARREDRRNTAECQFAAHGLAVERMPAVEGRWARNLRGYAKPGAYGCALSHRLILRAARLERAGAVLIFEDDVALHPCFRALAEVLKLPDDWEIFYFGCRHRKEPVPVGPGIVRVTRAVSTHAFAVRGRSLLRIQAAMNKPDGAGKRRDCDSLMADLHSQIPVYAAFPNLAWQAAGHSDLKNTPVAPYREEDGEQTQDRTILVNARQRMAEITSGIAPLVTL